MTEPTIEQIQEDVNTRIAAFGEELAKELAPEVATLLRRALDDFKENDHDPLWEEIIVPALAWHTLLHLGHALSEQSQGWTQVFYTNLRERWEKEKP